MSVSTDAPTLDPTPTPALAPAPIAHISRRALLVGALGAAFAGRSGAQSLVAAPRVEVWKSPTCGCCKGWIEHMRANGFRVETHDTGNAEARERLGIAERYASCHTAVVGGYAIEGHVPADAIRRLLNEKPAALGLAAPGMPIGSPGMDGPEYGGRKDAYDVLLVRRDGTSSVYRRYA